MKNKKLQILIILIIFSFKLNGQITICGEYKSHHPIDVENFKIKDSLIENGIDTILVYRHWKYTNGFNGYGKVIWKDNGINYQCKTIFENNETKALGIQKLDNDSLINYYFKNGLDTIKENPTNSMVSATHDASHFVEISYGKKSYCYVIKGFIVFFNPENLRANWINILADEIKSPITIKGARRKR